MSYGVTREPVRLVSPGRTARHGYTHGIALHTNLYTNTWNQRPGRRRD